MKIAFFETSPSDEAFLRQLLPPGSEAFFTAEPLSEETASFATEAEIISVFIYSSISPSVLDLLPKLATIATRSTGFDHIDIDACAHRGIVVQNVPHYGENTVAEHTFALILALSRNVHKSYARGLKGDYSIDGLIGFDLKGKTLGVIGTGRIGLHVIRIARGFGMNVLAFDTREDTFLSEILHFRYETFENVLASSDILSLHIPLNKETHHLINQDSLRLIKKGALLINTSRGGIVDNKAIAEGLDRGILSGAGFDVLEGEEHFKEERQFLRGAHRKHLKSLAQETSILSRDNVVFTPHIGFYSTEALERILRTTLQNIASFLAGNPENSIR